jgi:hypothetical protein
MDETMKVIAGVFLLVSVSMLVFGGIAILQMEHDAAINSTTVNELDSSGIDATSQGLVATMSLAGAIPILLLLLVVIALAGMLWFSIR